MPSSDEEDKLLSDDSDIEDGWFVSKDGTAGYTDDKSLLALKKQTPAKPHKRRLSGHISSRWYRSPETILLERNYDSQIDMWGVGCILAELAINMPEVRTKKKKIMFPGHCCYPLSPSQVPSKNQHCSIEKDD